MTNEIVVKTMSRIASFIDAAIDELLEFQLDVAIISTSGRNFGDGDHIPQLVAANTMLNAANALIIKLSEGSTKKERQRSDVGESINDVLVEPFSSQGMASLTLDISEINANGENIHRILYSLIHDYGEGSGVAESAKALYNIAFTAYAELQRIVPKFLIKKGSLSAVHSLKSLLQPPEGYAP
jgi:hypothetical protein